MQRIRTLRVRTLVWLAVLVIPALLPGTAKAQAATAPEAGAQAPSPRLLADASWHGRPIQRPLPRRSNAVERAPSLTPGTGFRRPGGSRRVRDLQRRLIRLGYRPGRSDGLFGPRTQAAVLAFQRKHGLERTGSVGEATLDVLRVRTAPGAGPPAEADPPVAAQSAPQPPEPEPAPPVEPTQAIEGDGPLTTLLLLALAVPLVLLAGLLVRGRRAPASEGPPPGPPALPPAAPVAAEELPAKPEPEPEPEPEPQPGPDPVPSGENPRIRRVAPPRISHVQSQERRAALRERILRMRADGMTLQEIADLLTEEGEVTLGGARRWQPWSVRAATKPPDPRGRHIADTRNGGRR